MSSTSSKQKVLRPLPAIPSSSTPQCPTSPRPPRPLPSPPCAIPPRLFDTEYVNSLSASEIKLDSLPRQPQTRSDSLFSASALKPPEIGEKSEASPIPALPKPHEDQHRLEPPLHSLPKLRPNRLRLHVDELILDDSDGWATSMNRTLSDGKVPTSYDRLHGPVYVRAAISMENLLDTISEKDVEGVEGGGKTVRIECFQAPKDADFRFDARFSRHWLREKRGRRWEEEDYQSILDTLRSL